MYNEVERRKTFKFKHLKGCSMTKTLILFNYFVYSNSTY